jgi:hypothetical protein
MPAVAAPPVPAPPTRAEARAAASPLPDFVRPAIVAVAVLLLGRGIASPFNAWHELNDAVIAQLARNHVRYGLGFTHGYGTWGDTVAPPSSPQRYLSHPPLLALFTASSLAVFGDHEWSARLVPIVATLGSALLLTTITARLGGAALGALAGFFFVTLPLTAWFGRMVCHEAPVQFFSLLMIHGYLEWTGVYGDRRPRRGAILYAIGAVLGVGTGWAALLAAGLLGAGHAWRVARGRGEARILLPLALVPAIALAAVVLHIAAGCGWDLEMLTALFARRSLAGEGGHQPWSAWLALQWGYFTRSFTWPGAVAALVAAPLVVREAFRSGRADFGRRFPVAGDLAGVAAVCALQGTLWVVVLKNESWFHDYWQFFLGPFVALAMAALTLVVRDAVARRSPGLARLVVALLLVAPMPFAAAALDFYAAHRLVDPEYIQALVALRGRVPPRAPVWTSHRIRESSETIGRYTYRWPHPVVAYYADRPLFHSHDLAEVLANAPGCVAYVLKRSEQRWAGEIEDGLARSWEAIPVGEQHVVFLRKESTVNSR